MGDIYQDFYAGAQNCINTSFCLDGGSFDSSDISLPRSLKIRVIANPDFWGFGDTTGNTLIEGWGTFNNGYFDFFDGYEPDHKKGKDCNEDGKFIGPFTNEQRPDVTYRSVYDPEKGDKHYANGSEDDIIRGGAESYILDRPAEKTTDNRSCDTDDPLSVFKTNPAGYGIAPKILFNTDIYKNITGSWRINECSGCYTEHDGGNELRNLDCSGAPKQHIQGDENFATLYDPFRNRCVASGFAGESGCNSDGVIASEYAGSISGIFRDTGVSPFLQYHFQYNGGVASGIFNGKSIGITATSGDGGALTFFDVQHTGNSTRGYAVGSQGKSNYSNTDSGTWTLFDSYDPNTCCGGAAYGVDPALMNLTNSPLYHIDIGRVFNDPKNKIYSNRIDRTYNGLTVEPEVPKGTFGVDHKYIAVNETGNALLVESGALYEVDLACQIGVWSATGDYIYKLDGQYSTESGIGAEALSTDSGFYPLFPKTLPYYGPFDKVDRFDYTERSNQYGNKQKNRNATCYTKQGSLSVYPDCLTQFTPYTDCNPKQRYDINNIPRLAFVYKGCDYNEPCTFDDSGRPWTAGASGHPSGMDDLIRGFGGQEIQMYINLGTARGSEIKREPCCCKEPPCPGTNAPEYVQIPSPVTFPCFPKFDLRPEDYGCKDPHYYFDIMMKLGLPTSASGACGIPYYDACRPTQPYATYGYLRNLCGKETNSRRGVIDSLSNKLHTGDYNDLDATDDTIEPMYVEFEQDKPDCCSPSGFSTGSAGCDPGLDFTTYGSGASGELVIDAAGGITYNVTAAGSGYQFGGGVLKIPTSTLSPEQTFDLTFGTAETGLSSFTSTPGGPATPTGVTIPLTIVAGGSGAAATGGFTYTSCTGEDFVHYWGLTDYQGRLSSPYYRTEKKVARICGKEAGDYIDYSETGTIIKDWPKDEVPFLVEIDHEEHCVGCSTMHMPNQALQLELYGLPTSYSHGQFSIENDNAYQMYGFNHCAYTAPFTKVTPIYDPATDTWEEDFCEEGDGLSYKYGDPEQYVANQAGGYQGGTCACMGDEISPLLVTMAPRFLGGTNIPIGYSTGYVPFGPRNSPCGTKLLTYDFNRQDDTIEYGPISDVMRDHVVYFSATIQCLSVFENPFNTDIGRTAISTDTYYGDGLGALWGCGDGCATSFPSVNDAPSLELDFYFVKSSATDLFEQMSPQFIHQNPGLLKNGLIYTDANLTSKPDSTIHADFNLDGWFPKGDTGGNDGDDTWPQGCVGSKIYIYSCMLHESMDPTKSNGNFDFMGIDKGICAPGTPGGLHSSENDPTLENEFVDGDGGLCYAITSYRGAGMPCASGSALLGCYGDLKPDVLNACENEEIDFFYHCWNPEFNRCCMDYEGGNGPERNRYEDWLFPRTTHVCYCDDFQNMEIMRTFEWKQTSPDGPGIVDNYGWYCSGLFYGDLYPHANGYMWSGENIPGLGNVGPLQIDNNFDANATAISYNEVTSLPNGAGKTITTESACSYHTGPNSTINIGAEVFTPHRPERDAFKSGGGTPNLQPETCSNTTPGDLFYSNCGTPIPWDTYVGGKGSYNSREVGLDRVPADDHTITVVRRSTWPEIQTVHKVECLSDGYLLHVSKEYFEHDRYWHHVGVNCDGNAAVTPMLGLIDGGETSTLYDPTGCIRYDDGVCITDCDVVFNVDCADASGAAGETSAGTAPTYFTLPVMTPSDSVHPKFPVGHADAWHCCHTIAPCATGTSVFDQTDASYPTFGFGSHTTSEEHPSGCMYFPDVSGEKFWGYYNLLYDENVPGSEYLSGSGQYVIENSQCGDCPTLFPFNLINVALRTEEVIAHPRTPTAFTPVAPVFPNEFEMSNHGHSCIQDLPECGGMFWNNKEFFPRKNYNIGTRVTAFGALSICEQTAQLQNPAWYGGSPSTAGPSHTQDTWDQSPNKAELERGRFIDACDTSAAVLADVGQHMDSDLLHVPFLNEDGTQNSLLTLMGVIHPGFKSNLNEKTCLYPDSGCLDFLAEHNDNTIRKITFTPDEYGYYLDHLVASGSHGCLFSPFKIMVDVECCSDRIGHKGTSLPTSLSYISEIPASTCQGWVADPPCACADSCTRYDEGIDLPGLSQMQGLEFVEFAEYEGYEFFNSGEFADNSGVLCYDPQKTHCICDSTVEVVPRTSATDPSHPQSRTMYHSFEYPAVAGLQSIRLLPDKRYQIFNPNGGSPWDLLTEVTIDHVDGTDIYHITEDFYCESEWGITFGTEPPICGESSPCPPPDDECCQPCGDIPDFCSEDKLIFWTEDIRPITAYMYRGKVGTVISSDVDGDYPPEEAGSEFCMDIVEWKGDKYAWVGNGVSPQLLIHSDEQNTQCCDNRTYVTHELSFEDYTKSAHIYGAIEPHPPNGGTVQDPTGPDWGPLDFEYGKGCCDWNFCHVYSGLIPLDVGDDWTGSAFGGGGWVIDGHGTAVVIADGGSSKQINRVKEALDEYGCQLTHEEECSYTSKIWLEITAPPTIVSGGGTTTSTLSPTDVLAMVFMDESSPYHDWTNGEANFNAGISAWENYMVAEGLDSAICLCQPGVTYDWLLPPSRQHLDIGRAFPDFVSYSQVGRNASCTLDQLRDHFLATAGGTVPRALGIFIDISGSMNRSTIEPAVDQFIAWYKAWSKEQTGTEGCVVEVQTTTEAWLAEALDALKQADSSCP